MQVNVKKLSTLGEVYDPNIIIDRRIHRDTGLSYQEEGTSMRVSAPILDPCNMFVDVMMALNLIYTLFMQMSFES